MPPSPSKLKSAKRLAAETFGRRGEDMAAWYLRSKFYRVVEKRYKTPVGEIDLIVDRRGVIVFVEVKTRQRREDELDAMLHVNKRRVVRAAQFYLTRNPRVAEMPMRFDVIFLAPFTWPRHVKDAFDAS